MDFSFSETIINKMIVSIANSVKYGNYKQYKGYSSILESEIELAEDKIRNEINLPEHVVIKLRPMRNKLGQAVLISEKITVGSVDVNVRQTLPEFRDTLLHELIHIEQFYENRLEQCTNVNFYKWNGVEMFSKPTEYAEYIKLPWEREAMKRATKLISKIFC
jgi:hypothetical protein